MVLEKKILNVVNVFSLCVYYIPLTKAMAIHWNKLESSSSRNDVCQARWNLTRWFWRSKYVKSFLWWRGFTFFQIKIHSNLKKKIMGFRSPNRRDDIHMCLLIRTVFLRSAMWPMSLFIFFSVFNTTPEIFDATMRFWFFCRCQDVSPVFFFCFYFLFIA